MFTVEEFLNNHHITYIRHEHPAVCTCKQAEKHCRHIACLQCKNLFLRDERKRRFFLYTLPAGKNADLKRFARQTGERRISFASAELLHDKLGLEPGSVSPFGLINDLSHVVEYYLDRTVYEAERLSFHPNRNTASLELTGSMFRRYLEASGCRTTILD